MWPALVTSWKNNCGPDRYSWYSVGLMLPLRLPWKLSRSAMMAETSGEDRLVPPMPNQPGTGWLPLDVAQTPFGGAALPGQNSGDRGYSSASAEVSGDSRPRVPVL